jgi:hypothetical protein
MSVGSRLAISTALVFATLLGAAVPAGAADLGLVPGRHVRHAWVSRGYWDWRARCAYAGYYCLYAEYGTVYHYPFDDRPIAYAHYRRHYR